MEAKYIIVGLIGLALGIAAKYIRRAIHKKDDK